MTAISETTVGQMVEAASALLAQRGDGDHHTVAAAICAESGLLYTALNVYHFTGGPCAEIVALGRLVSEGGGRPLAIVAVADRGRGVVAPCGRCRQVLMDYCPNIQVVLPSGGAPVVKPLGELLPGAYVWAEQQ